MSYQSLLDGKTADNIDLIWKHMHPDFKGAGEEKCVMWNSGSSGTVLGPIESMPDNVFSMYLKSAIRREVCEVRDQKLEPIYIRYGLQNMMNTAQFRENLDAVIEVFKGCLACDVAEIAIGDILRASVVFPEDV